MLVYKATFKNGKSYIGITSQSLEKRKNEHFKFSKKLNLLFYKAIRKYGKESIEWSIIESDLSIDRAKEQERYYIQLFNTFAHNDGYNATLGGDGVFGYKFSDEQRKMISERTKEAMKNIPKANFQTNLGKPALNRKKVIDSNGIIYESLTSVAKKFNVTISAVNFWLKYPEKQFRGLSFKVSK